MNPCFSPGRLESMCAEHGALSADCQVSPVHKAPGLIAEETKLRRTGCLDARGFS